MGNPTKKIAIIIPVFNEAENIRFLYDSLLKTLEKIDGYSWEFIFVDDGSQDDSWEVLEALTGKDTRVQGIMLSRNFGKEIALTAGVESVEDVDAVICIDADMQHPPELIPDFIREWKKGYEVVTGVRWDAADYTLTKKIGSRLFYWIINRCCDVNLTPNGTDYRLLDRKVVQTLRQFSERTRMFRGLIDWMGFRSKFIEFRAPCRHNHAKPSYSYRKLIALAINSITSFSLLPLRLTGYLGGIVTFFSSLIILVMIITSFAGWQVYTMQAYFIVFITFLVGVMLSGLGLMAIYIGHIHTEVVGRPLYIVREKTNDQIK